VKLHFTNLKLRENLFFKLSQQENTKLSNPPMHRGNIFSLMLDFTPCYRSKTAGVDYSTSLFM